MIGRGRRIRKHQTSEELELTAFINPMVVLVTYLLINVVFSHSAVLNLSLPAPATGAVSTPPEKLLLEITVRKDAIEVGDRNRGRLLDIPTGQDGPDFARLSDELMKLKTQYPTQKDASVLLEPDISYDLLVQVMDTVRSVEQQIDGHRALTELFPEIAIGDAPEETKKQKVN